MSTSTEPQVKPDDNNSNQKKRRGFIASLSLAFDIITGSLRLLRLYPVLILPLVPVFFLVLVLDYGLLFVNSLVLALVLIYVVAYSLMFSFSISSMMIQQIHERQKPSLRESISSPKVMQMIPKVILLSLVWYLLVLVIVAIQLGIKILLSRSESASEKAEAFVDRIFGTVSRALRMMGFMLVPIMVFEDVGLSKGFQRLKSTLSDSPISALSGLVLTELAVSVTFLIVTGVSQFVESLSTIGFVVSVAFLGIGWLFVMYIEQLFSTGLYLYTTYPESPVVDILLEKHIGRELPRVPPELLDQPLAS